MATRRSPSRGEKALLWSVTVFVVIVGGFALWRGIEDIDPVAPVIPTPAMPIPNARDYYLKACDAFVPITITMQERSITVKPSEIGDWNDMPVISHDSVAFSPLSPSSIRLSRNEIMTLARRNAPVFAMLRQGFHYEFRELPYRSFTTSIPYSKYRQIAYGLRFDALARRLNRDWDGAVNDGLDGIRLGEDIPHGSITKGIFRGLEVQSISRVDIWQSVDHLNADQARAAIKRMIAIFAHHVPVAEVLQEDEWATQASLMEIFRKPNWRGELSKMAFAPETLIRVRIQFECKRQVMQSYTRYMDAAIAYAKLPYNAPKQIPARPDDLFTWTMIPSLRKLEFGDTFNETQNNLLTVSFALRAYKVEHGKYPASLKELVPSYLHAIPADPFAANGMLLYKQNGNSYILYSVGPDGKDDGGKASADGVINTAGSITTQQSTGDIVAGVNVR